MEIVEYRMFVVGCMLVGFVGIFTISTLNTIHSAKVISLLGSTQWTLESAPVDRGFARGAMNVNVIC